MNIFKIHPGYLSDTNLLKEFFAVKSVLEFETDNFEKTKNLQIRSKLLIAEMEFRNLNFSDSSNSSAWEDLQVKLDTPADEFNVLDAPGRIPSPRSAQELWKHHKYSVMARSVPLYQEVGRRVSKKCTASDFSELAIILTRAFTEKPSDGGIRNVLHHLWGYVSKVSTVKRSAITDLSFSELLTEIQHCVLKMQEPYLMESTAITELKIWIE